VIDLQRDGDVFVLRMDYGENRFRPDKIDAWNRALDEVEKVGKPSALVTTGTGKFYSNGLDLDWMLGDASPEERAAYIPAVLAVMARVLTFPCITVCALNGHAFGAGAQIALAHDYRVMRRDRGYFCMPEIDMGAPLHPGMTAIIQARLPHQTAHQVITEGRRYGADEARAAKIVDHVADEAEVVPRAIALAASLAGKAHPIMRKLKSDMYPRALEALAAPLPDMPPLDG
jgi:enoyl-CoA hydratase/carnithine racemase